jgi:type III secretory pathway component EscS
LVLIGGVALAVRVGYLLAYKHPVFIGGDPYWYHYGANLLADGHGVIDAYLYKRGITAQSATHPPGTLFVLAAASLLGMRSFFWHQLVMCLLGSLTVVIIAATANLIAGHRAGIIAGLLAAFYPNLWLNDALVVSETVVQLTTALTVLAAYRWWKKPTRGRAALVGAGAAACALTRAEAVLLVPLLVIPLILFSSSGLRWANRAKHALVSVGVCLAVMAPWVGYNLARFDRPEFLSSGFGSALAVANCDATYYGPLVGWWSQPCVLRLPPAKGDQSVIDNHDRAEALRYIRAHEDRLPAVVGARLGRVWGFFRPVQQIKLDMFETRELRFSEVGLAMFYALAAGTIGALWWMRRRRVPISPILAPILEVSISAVLVYGTTRFRASAEVVLVLGGAVGLTALVSRLQRPRASAELASGATGSPPAPTPESSATGALRRPSSNVPEAGETYPTRPRNRLPIDE